MNNLSDFILKNEEWLTKQILNYAEAREYTKYTSTRIKECRLSVSGISQSLLKALKRDPLSLELSPDEDFTKDPIAVFGIVEARLHRRRGIDLGMFLVMMKYFRQAYMDLLYEANFDLDYENHCRYILARFFDRLEIALCTERTSSDDKKLLSELQASNRILTNKKNKYLAIFENQPNPIILLDPNNCIDHLNPAAVTLISKFNMPGKYYCSIKDRYPEKFYKTNHNTFAYLDGENIENLFPWIALDIKAFTKSKDPMVRFDKKITHENGTHYFDVKFSRMPDVTDKFNGTMIIIEDLTTQKQAEAEVKKANDLLWEKKKTLKAILSASPVGIGLVRNRIISWGNKTMYDLIGYKESFFEGKNAKLLYPSVEEFYRVGHEFHLGIKKTGIGQTETQWITKDGKIIDCYIQTSPLDPSDPSRGLIAVVMDITELKKAKKHIQTLTHQLIKAQETERQRIAYDLHDHLAQELSALKIDCEMLFADPPRLPDEIGQRISKISETLERTIQSVRNLSYDLRPPDLDYLGLARTVSQYCKDFSEKTGIKVDFFSAGLEDLRFDSDTEINLYRLVQEALNNIRKHADAGQVTIRLLTSFPNIILRMEDNGKGFDVEKQLTAALNEKRMGIQSMRQRVALLKGKIRIQSVLNQGTSIFIEVPCRNKSVIENKL